MVYCLSCLHNVPEGVLFSPRYFPDMNTYVSAVYQIYYAFMGNLLFHFQECLQISVLLMRMSILSKILEKHFKPLSPMYVSLTLFVVCLLINIETAFTSKIVVLGEYVTTGNSSLSLVYDFANTDFVSSQLGSIIQTFTYFFLNIFCTLIVGITLNIVSFVQYKVYLSDKKRFINSGIQQQNAQSETITLSKLRKSEKSMLFMIITLCSISIVSSIVFILCAMYFVFWYPFG
jgi:hypothetical protein